jgi:hypothetical protein
VDEIFLRKNEQVPQREMTGALAINSFSCIRVPPKELKTPTNHVPGLTEELTEYKGHKT